ncbi:aldo/keto reductase [Halosimplex aquaticum]|uniref:Aldo/keto reductase n=1 Tax=Halosimplex aquaticum TaxID=3026162 RepID=A0ABD5XUQ5_9EURY|nr:aldo/keto reductase [Halosimplex aquaticum]
METRPLGDTGQESSVLTFGAIALDFLDQDEANELTEDVLDRGVNHVDVAPQYGTAEVKLAPTLADRRDEVFLGCKTLERGYEGAWEKLEESLDRLGTDHIDLYQFHAVTEQEEIDEITADDGALKAYREAQEEGIIDHIGVTSHGRPEVIREAVERIPDLATAMFPVNATVAAKDDADHAYLDLASELEDRGIGVISIKTFAKQPWPEDLDEDDRPYNTWYEPYDDPEELARCLRYTLSQDVTTLTNAGDPRLVGPILDAAQSFEPMSDAEQQAMVDERRSEESPVPADLG